MGEFDLLERLREALPPAPPHLLLGVGDDAAVTAGAGVTVTSVDLLVEDVHFRRATFSPAQAGHKALAAALSDLAAMGARAGEAYLALTVPPGMDEDECMELLAGVSSLAESLGVALAGGDVSRASILTLGVTVVGRAADASAVVRRSGAAPGDVLVATGVLGGAAAGLALIEDPGLLAPADDAVRAALVARQLAPQPRLAAGEALARAGATAMIDISDGLAGDAGHLARESGVSIEIEAGGLSVQEGVTEVEKALGCAPLDLVLGGGEDYELLAALPAGRDTAAREALADIGVPLARIGEVGVGNGVSLRSGEGRRRLPSGFDQLRHPRSSP